MLSKDSELFKNPYPFACPNEPNEDFEMENHQLVPLVPLMYVPDVPEVIEKSLNPIGIQKLFSSYVLLTRLSTDEIKKFTK